MIRAIEPTVRALPRVAPPRGDRVENPRAPVVWRAMAASWPAMTSWSLDALRARWAELPVLAARVDGGDVRMDPRHGLLQDHVPLGAFLDALRGGARDRYVMAPLAQLPAAIVDDAPWPAWCARAPWRDGNLWIGAPDTVSGLHFDLADNVHVQVSGRKRFTVAAPTQSPRLYPNGPWHGVPNGARVDLERPDLARFPRLRGAEVWQAELEPGDGIYLPGGWWHQVRTLDVSVSVNFWWARGARRAVVLGADWFKRVANVSR